MPAASFSQRHEHESSRDGWYNNAKRYLSSAFLPTKVDLPLTLALSRLPPSLSPGVLWHSTRLALTLLLLASRCLTAAEAGCFAAHGINDATGHIAATGSTRAVPRTCQNRRETAVTSGRSRTSQTASDLGMDWLTRCVKHTSKERVAGWQVESLGAQQVVGAVRGLASGFNRGLPPWLEACSCHHTWFMQMDGNVIKGPSFRYSL